MQGTPIRRAGAATIAAALVPFAAAQLTAIYTNIPGHPTAQVPGVPGEQFRSNLAPFLTLYGSPDGRHWVFKAFTDNDAANDVIVVGSGTVGAVVAKEGDPSPLKGLAYGFMDSDCGINDAGRYAFGNRLAGGPTSTDEVLFAFDGSALVVAAREGDPAPGLVDPLGAGDELFGNSLNSAHVLADGTVGFRADVIQNVDSDFESALYHGAAVRAQEGTSVGTLAGTDVYDSFVALAGNTFTSNGDGSEWIVEADVLPGLGTVEAVVVTGNVELRDGDVLPGGVSPVDAIFSVQMAGNGDWYVRGETLDGLAFAVRNGEVVATGGDPVIPDAANTFTGFSALNGNPDGDWVLVGTTSDGGQVAVLNGRTVVAKTGDPIDLGAGPTGVFLDSIAANDAFLATAPDELYVFASMVDDAGADAGDAFLVIPLGEPTPCPWDCGDGNGVVDTVDFLALLAEWGRVGTPCDFDGNGVDTVDFLALLASWGSCP